MLNLAVLLEDSARTFPDRDAVVHGKTRLTYAELDAQASQVAGALAARGIGRGDRVALSCPNLPCFPVVYYGILKAGATVVPLNILLTEREIAYHLADSAARVYVCFGVSQLDLSVPGVTGLMTGQPLPGLARLATGAAGMVDGAGIAAGFAWLRPGELVWSHWVNNYLMGQDPPAFDILAWNDDSTRLPGALVRQLLGIAEGNLLAVPGGVTLLGTPVDLAEVGVPAYVVGAETDHLVPWAASYQTTRLLGGENTFVLSGGGHIQHLVNPPGNPKARFRTGPVTGASAEEWLAGATTRPGTWWDHWTRWGHARSGPLRPAPATVGSERHRPLEPAPGLYAKEK